MNSNNLQQFPDYVYKYPNCQSCEDTLQVLNLHLIYINQNELEVDIVGLKPFIVNAIRQTILNDVPTMAIEDVYFHKNSSTFNCDYICQRLALIPIKVDSTNFKFISKTNLDKRNSDNTIVLNLNAKNTQEETIKVYSKSLCWEPVGEKQKLLPIIEPLFSNIPLLHLKPNEEISCKIHCIKDTGRNHIKFSPGFARYCFLSKIDFVEDNFSTELALKLQKSFPRGVIGLKANLNNEMIPYVLNARLDRHTRSFKNEKILSQNIDVKYYRDHIIFTIESYGVVNPDTILIQALDIMNYKYNFWKQCVQNIKVCSNKAKV